MINKRYIIEKLKSPWTILLFAMLMAASISFLAYQYLQNRELRIKEEAQILAENSKVPEVSLLVPNTDLPIGSIINSSNFSARPIAEDLVYPNAVRADDFQLFEGFTLAKPVQKGLPILLSDLMAQEVKDVANILPAGKRAVTISIDNLNSIAQTVKPGNKIDIFLINQGNRINSENSEQSSSYTDRAILFMQSVEVLAVGQDFKNPTSFTNTIENEMLRAGDIEGHDNSYDTITLLVNIQEAAKLMLGQQLGNYRIVLRGSKDLNNIDIPILQAADVLPKAPAVVLPEEVQMIIGGGGGQNNIASMQKILTDSIAKSIETSVVSAKNFNTSINGQSMQIPTNTNTPSSGKLRKNRTEEN